MNKDEEYLKINLNDLIKVRLTEYGEKIHFDYLYHYLKNTWPIRELLPEMDSEGYTKYTLWQFMSMFGEKMYNGGEQVIKDNEIVIVPKSKGRW